MPRNNVPLQAFNRGIVSPLALARTDIDRVALSAEIQTNWMPRTLGSMMLRPGTAFVGRTKGDKKSRFLKFIFSTTETSLIELSDKVMRIWTNDALVSRSAVSTIITNGGFDSDLSGWSDTDESDAVSSWVSGNMQLVGTGFNAAKRNQQVSVSSGDANKVHGLRISVTRGPVTLRVGSSAGDDSYITETVLATGTHSLTLSPAGNFFVEFSSRLNYPVLVNSISIESSGVMEITTPWPEGDLPLIRYDQSGDVVFVACKSYQQQRIERRNNNSWSVVNYESTDGPFGIENTTGLRITPSGLSGVITLTASSPLFKSGNVGSLFRLESTGQTSTVTLNGSDQFTDYVKVTGIGDSRKFTINRTQIGSGPWSGTLTLQRSVSSPGAWVDVESYAPDNGSFDYNDQLDNSIIYYRIGYKAGAWSSGSLRTSISFAGGSRTGIVRVTAVSSPTSASAIVLSQLGGTSATEIWSEGDWSGKKGWPSAVALYEGRLWWAGKDKFWGSVSDAYDSFDDTTEGDSGPISGAIGSGPVDTINWLMPLLRLLVGTQGAEASIRSSSFDEPLTPTNFGIKFPSTQGSTAIAAVKIDSSAIFVQRGGVRVYELTYDSGVYDYVSNDMTTLCPEIGYPEIVAIDAHRQPDTRIHCVRGDGKVAIQVYDKVENVRCWVLMETDGIVEDVVTLPGTIEDKVYYVVNREGKRCLERWSLESECRGGQLTKLADSHIVYTGSPVSNIAGLDHLEGKEVVCWADGFDIGTMIVSGGSISLPLPKSNIVVGLGYSAPYKSAKLAYSAGMGTALSQRKRVDRVGLILSDTHAQGLMYGPDFEIMDDMPRDECGAYVPDGKIWDAYDNDAIEFPGDWDTDSRICLMAKAPRPVTILAAIIGISTNDK
ncbi:hypothetical protein PMPD1_3082 [Paramixta manurensis]|uniref:Uncharacterized protein n=1 Tax=Paramixta manurensis TaxID=2740817 RepID=A0A6M8UBG9_9GAMM|nr:hypothetical protein PMPD1_3082 [Erwiniaceae bacterium PD-1]